MFVMHLIMIKMFNLFLAKDKYKMIYFIISIKTNTHKMNQKNK